MYPSIISPIFSTLWNYGNFCHFSKTFSIDYAYITTMKTIDIFVLKQRVFIAILFNAIRQKKGRQNMF